MRKAKRYVGGGSVLAGRTMFKIDKIHLWHQNTKDRDMFDMSSVLAQPDARVLIRDIIKSLYINSADLIVPLT